MIKFDYFINKMKVSLDSLYLNKIKDKAKAKKLKEQFEK